MSFTKISRRARSKGKSERMGSQFLKRLDKGLLIDRTAQEVGVKNPKVVPVPKALAGRQG